MKKILYVITKSNWGGAQRYVFDLASSLPKHGFDAAVAFGQEGRLAEELRKHGIPIHPLRALERDVSVRADLRSFFELYRLFRALRPDVVHLNSSKAAGLGALAARLAGVPRIIFTAHGWPFWEKRGPAARALIRFFSWLTALFAHTTICVSNYDLRVARRMPLAGNKATLIYNGIAPIDFLPAKPHEGVRVLTNGELNDNKNLFVGIDAVAAAHKHNSAISYVIMSDGELRSSLEHYIAQKGYGNFVSLLGFVPDGARHYMNYDIFFLPSKKEGLPYVLLEAGLAGLPVVASNVGGIPEIVQNGVSGIMRPPSDTPGFTEELIRLSSNPATRLQFGNALKEKIAREFSLTHMIEKTLALYR